MLRIKEKFESTMYAHCYNYHIVLNQYNIIYSPFQDKSYSYKVCVNAAITSYIAKKFFIFFF